MYKNKKAFTLIELLVTIAVLGILVLLASPRFFGHTQNAELAKGFANARSIEKASELYYMDNNDWPRLTDDPYTSEEIESYSERIFNHTGHEVNLDPEGNYYDIDYDKLSDYIQVPDDKKNYILQNPVGKIYYMENLNEAGKSRVDYSNDKEKDDNPGGLRKPEKGEIAIDSADKLAKIGQPGEESEYPLNGKYILTDNIDLLGYSEGEGWKPIGNNSSKFTGSFDGNGYKITGLTINRSETRYVGLFGHTERATISNVALEDINVTGQLIVGGLVGYAGDNTKISNSYSTGSVTGGGQVGGLMGWAYSSTIENSYSTGSVTSTGSGVGGFVGKAEYSAISNSYTEGSVTGNGNVGGIVGSADKSTMISISYATGSVEGTGDYVGGIVGYTSKYSKISNSYTTGSVVGTKYVGGLAGYAGDNSTIRSSYATGSVTGTSNAGGLVGDAYILTISNSYWDTQTTGQYRSSGGGRGTSTVNMKKKATYLDGNPGWDFDTIWTIQEGVSYPTLINNPER